MSSDYQPVSKISFEQATLNLPEGFEFEKKEETTGVFKYKGNHLWIFQLRGSDLICFTRFSSNKVPRMIQMLSNHHDVEIQGNLGLEIYPPRSQRDRYSILVKELLGTSGWRAHCLDNNIQSEGETQEEALDTLMWTIETVRIDDFEKGDWRGQRFAEQKYWDEYKALKTRGV